MGAPLDGPAPNSRLARAALSSAIASYRGGFHQRSRYFLIIAERHDPAWLAKRADAHKLRALLFLSEDRPQLAARSLVESVKLKPDPFAFYLLGNYNLRMRSYRQARASYRAAVLTARDLSEKAGKSLVDPKHRVLVSELPFACPAVEGGAGVKWVEAARHPPFGEFELSDGLWNRGLHPLEYASAAYQALALTRYLNRSVSNRRPGAPQSDDAALLLSELGRYNLARAPQSGIKVLIRGRTRDGNYRACLRNLETLERREAKRIRLGSTDPAVHRLKAIREAIRRMHRLRLSWFGSARTWFSFASYLKRRGRRLEALHAFRKALELSPLELRATSLKGNLRERVQIYRLLAETYKELGRSHDAESVSVFAHEIENYQNKSLDFATGKINNGKAGGRLILKLLRRGRLYTWNREGLLLLISHARNTGDARLGKYRKRLAERDERFDEVELLSALRDYRE